MRRRQGPDCYPQAAAAQHLEALLCLATLQQMIFLHWVVGRLYSNNNLHNSNSRHPRDNNNLCHHHMTVTHLD
jgi:hypothetical protein